MLRGTLELLARQELAGVSAEIVVVDNGSGDGSREAAERWAAEREGGPPLKMLHEPRPGPAAARNTGVRAAEGRLVLFLGDDCRPAAPTLVAGHARAHDGGAAAVSGRTDWDPAVEITPVMDWLLRSGKQFDFGRAEREEPGPWLFYTSNVSLPRDALEAAGGFDERFPSASWEDYELALRLADAGVRFAYRPDLVVLHHHSYHLRDSLGHMEGVGRSAALLNRLQPHRRPLPAPAPSGLKADLGRLLAPSLRRVPQPPVLRDQWFRVAHYAALARGYAHGHEPNGAPGRPPRERRERVSVVVPFAGDAAAGADVAAALARLELAEGDEAIVVDNTPEGVLGDSCGPARVIHDAAERSSYHARNSGARAARNPWLLFLDADCVPRPGLLDAYFPPGDAGAVAGGIEAAEQSDSLAARYSRSRGHLSQVPLLQRAELPFAVTANLLVRREAWQALGGFAEGVRSGGDADFSVRLQQAGFKLAYRDEAGVEHRHRESVRGLLRTAARYGAGRAWLDRRRQGRPFRPRPLEPLVRSVAGAIVWALLLRGERALFKLLDGAVTLAESAGYLLGNVPPGGGAAPAEIVVLADAYPVVSETFVTNETAALARRGRRVRVESTRRPEQQALDALGAVPVSWLEDDGLARRLGDLLWLLATRPVAALRDVRDSLRWRRQEPVRRLWSLAPAARRIVREGRPHLHAHFAAEAGLCAMRLARLTGARYSITAHAYDIFLTPRNLEEKLRGAAFTSTGCEYNARHLRTLAERVHVIVMGVDAERFRRESPHPGGRHVLAVGRLVEKKGFADLVAAAARSDLAEQVTIVGDGPLRAELEAQVERLGLRDRVQLVGALPHDEVRALMDQADLLAMPCVVAADGDRDSMPVVVKEALAMEIPVVATDEVGLPEVVREGWGRLVPPHDPEALAGAIDELLALPPEERARMGGAGRAFVIENCDVHREAGRLLELLGAR